MSLRRQLDVAETSFLKAGNYPCDICKYIGKIDDVALGAAYLCLCIRYPFLRGEIVRTNVGQPYEIVVQPDGCADITIREGDERVLKNEIHQALVSAEHVARLFLVKERTGGWVCLCINHAVGDYPVLGALFNELWGIYRRIVTGENVNMPCRQTLPVSPVSVLRKHWLKSEPTNVVADARASRNAVRSRSVIEQRVIIPESETASIMQFSREHSVTVHGLVCGAILSSIRRMSSCSGPFPMVCRSAVNLRNRIRPRIGETETTVLQGIQRAEVSVSEYASCLSIGKEVNEQLYRAVNERNLMMVWERLPKWEKPALEPRLREILISNWGVMSPIDERCGFRVVDRVVGWMDGEEAPWLAVNPGYLLGTFNNEFRIVGNYPARSFSRDDVEWISASIESNLSNLATSVS